MPASRARIVLAARAAEARGRLRALLERAAPGAYDTVEAADPAAARELAQGADVVVVGALAGCTPLALADELASARETADVAVVVLAPARDAPRAAELRVRGLHCIAEAGLTEAALDSAVRAALEGRRHRAEMHRLVHALGHELGNPLSGLAMLLSASNGAASPVGGAFVEPSQAAVAQMQRLLRRVLAYVDVAASARAVRPVDCGAVFEEAAAHVRDEHPGVQLELHTEALPCVQADPGQLRRLFVSLLDNAVRYRRGDRATVRITAARRGAVYELSVADDGVGIASVDLERAFEPLTRLHATPSGPAGGLGLALARRIVERHGGRIWLDAAAATGTTVRFTLPAAS